MNSTIATLAGFLGIVISLITIASTVWKASGAISELRRSQERLESALRSEISELQHQDEKLELLTNGFKERTEHINVRLTANYNQVAGTLEDVEGWLQKNTAYERRKQR